MVTAAEIASIWVHDTPNLKRRFIKDVIVDIYNEIPSTKEYKSARLRLRSVLDSLWYKAPEILNNAWLDIYHFLGTYLTKYADESKNPQWIKNIVTIWGKGNDKFDADCTDEKIEK